MSEAYVLGVGRTPYGRFPGHAVHDLVRTALASCLADAGIPASGVEGVFFSNATQGALEGQHLIRGQVALRRIGAALEGIPVVNVENACAGGATALHLAATAVRAGELDVALAIGAEKMYGADEQRTREGFLGGLDAARWAEELAALQAAAGAEPGGPGRRSVFMDVYAALATHYRRRHPSCTPRRLAAVTVKNRRHAALNPNAAHRTPLTVDDVLAARQIVPPLTLPMCAPIGDGAAAAVVCSAAALRRFGAARAVRIRAGVIASGTGRALDDDTRQITRRASATAYERAGLGPADISLAEVHDATAIGEVIQLEALGLVREGDGAGAAERGETALGGRLPVNTSGGLECNGHPIGATGIGQVHELVQQLRGEAGDRQVPGARIGLAENGGGFLGNEEAAAAVVILEAPGGAGRQP